MNVHVIYHLLKIAMETDILCFTTFSNVLKLWVYFWQKHLLDVIFITNFWDAHLSSQYRKMMFLKLSQTWQILMKPWLIIAITSINMASLFTFLCCTFRRNADCNMTDVADWPASPWCDSRSTLDAGASSIFPLNLNRSIASPANPGPTEHWWVWELVTVYTTQEIIKVSFNVNGRELQVPV